MADDVTPLHRCRCGAAGRVIALVQDGEPLVLSGPTPVACDRCLADMHAGAAFNRHLFDALLAEGVDRETANAMLCAKVDIDAGREASGGS